MDGELAYLVWGVIEGLYEALASLVSTWWAKRKAQVRQ